MSTKLVKVKYFSRVHHCSQVITGYYNLFSGRNDYTFLIEDHTNDSTYPYKGAIVEVDYCGVILAYDMYDGYQKQEEMLWFYHKCNFYFKRSYSDEMNKKFSFQNGKIYPYGFNYFVTYKGNPLDGPYYKELLKALLRKNHNTIFIPSAFEESPCVNKKPRVLFSVRLWPKSDELSDELNLERDEINEMRIQIVKGLREQYKDRFLGGLYDTALARKLAPELIVPDSFTIKKNYLSILHQADICVGTMGLHKSIGGKSGEYVAAAKAIVHESMYYEVPGCFQPGKNYLEFSSKSECLSSVEYLMNNPYEVFKMKCSNYYYYHRFLRPDALVENTLAFINIIL